MKFYIETLNDNGDEDEEDLQSIEECEYRDSENTLEDMCFCNLCECYMSKEECLEDCPLY